MGLAPKLKRPGTAARAWNQDMSESEQCLVEEVFFCFVRLGLISMSDWTLIFCVQGQQKRQTTK